MGSLRRLLNTEATSLRDRCNIGFTTIMPSVGLRRRGSDDDMGSLIRDDGGPSGVRGMSPWSAATSRSSVSDGAPINIEG